MQWKTSPLMLAVLEQSPVIVCNFLFMDDYNFDVWFVVSTVIASNLLLVDEIMRAGLSSLKG